LNNKNKYIKINKLFNEDKRMPTFTYNNSNYQSI
jgi:hypothetical protein